jgi:hypothetical protein
MSATDKPLPFTLIFVFDCNNRTIALQPQLGAEPKKQV